MRFEASAATPVPIAQAIDKMSVYAALRRAGAAIVGFATLLSGNGRTFRSARHEKSRRSLLGMEAAAGRWAGSIGQAYTLVL
jgi:hypothetical protein